MTDLQWPSQFPAPTIQSYSYKSDETLARTQMESGLARQRRRFTNVPARVKMRFIMSESQFGVFEGWYKWFAKEGAEWFYINLQNGSGYSNTQVRFLSPYKPKLLSNNIWEVTVDAEARELATLAEDYVVILIDKINIDDFELAVDKLHKQLHVTMPNPYWSYYDEAQQQDEPI